MTFRDAYTRLYDQAEPAPGLINRTLAAVRPAKGFSPRRAAALMLACVLALAAATSALATSSPDFNQWLYRYSPSTAMLFRPVNSVCEDQGIRMEVQAIHLDGNTAEIYVTLTDLQGNLLDETVDLFDSYWIDAPGGASAGCILADWNEETRQATFYIHYRSEKPIRQDKMTFSFTQLLTGKQHTTAVVASDLSGLPDASIIDPGARVRGWGGDDIMTMEAINALGIMALPETGMEIIPGVYYLGIGWVNDQLRVQMRYTDIARTDNHGFLWLEDTAGHTISSTAGISVWAENGRDTLEESIFPVTPDQLEALVLKGDFATCDQLLTGSWSVTFPLVEMTAE